MLSLIGKAEDAERDFRRALELNPSLADGCYFYARHLFQEGRLAEAAEMFEEAARKNPEDYASLCLLLSVYKGLGKRDRIAPIARRAVAAAERRLRHDPDDARALYLGGGAYVDLGDRKRDLACLERALELYPDELAPLYNAACIYAQMGDKERALDALERAIAGGRGARKWIENDRDLDSLREEPRFQALLQRVRS